MFKDKILNFKFTRRIGGILLSVVLMIVLTIGVFLFFNQPKAAEATWWNDAWQFRQSIQVTNNTSTENNVYISVTLDTATASTSMQADCGDFRFTRENGEVLPYYIVSGCRTATNVIHINFPIFDAGQQAIYFYYGNASAENGFAASDFATEASNYTIGAIGTAETGPGPVGYWSFDEGYGTVAHDESGQGNDGTITGATWKDESECVVGECLGFDGINDKVMISATTPVVNTVVFWVKATTTTASFLKLNDVARISASNGIVSASGFSSSTIYVNGTVKSDMTANAWYMIAITTATAINATSTIIGFSNNQYFGGYIDEVKIYPYARTADQIKQDYAAGLAGMKSNTGVSATFGSASDKWLSDGLVGYWKMDETATTSGAIDSSGNGNDGIYYGDASTTAGKFGNGGVFDGFGDHVDFSLNNDIRTISFWLKADNLTNNYFFFFPSSLDHVEISNYHITTGNINSLVYIDGIAITSVNDYNWHHIVIITETAIIGNSMHIGDMQGPPYYIGQIDEVRIYNRALSPREVRHLYEWAPGPVLHLKMDEKSGVTAHDSSGYGNNGTLIYMATSTNSGWTRGKYGSALNFDGVDDYVNADASLYAFDENDNFTISVWVNFDDITAQTGLIAGQSHSSYRLLQSNNQILWQLDSGNVNLYSNNTFNTGKWYYVTALYENSKTVSLYINGVLDNSVVDATLAWTGFLTMRIGKPFDDNFYFKGIIDDVKIYNYARTQKQILEDMSGSASGGNGGRASKYPVLHLSFDEGYGETPHDSSVYGNDGTVFCGVGGANTATSSVWSKNGKINGGMELDGIDDYIDASDEDFYDFWGTDSFAVSVWVKYAGNGGSKPNEAAIIEKWSGGSGGYTFVLRNRRFAGMPGQLYCNRYDGSNSTPVRSEQTDLNDNEWHHILCVHNGENKTMTMYVDGVLSSSTPYTSALGDTTNSQPWHIGRRGGTYNNQFGGQVDELKIWNYALNEDEIKQEYNSSSAFIMGGIDKSANDNGTTTTGASTEYCVPGDTSKCSPPVLELKMDKKSGDTAYDTSGNGNDGTLMNMATSTNGGHVQGIIGSALGFDGVDDWVRIEDFDSSNSMTWSFWLKPNILDGSTDLFSKTDWATQKEWRINLDVDEIELQISNNGAGDEEQVTTDFNLEINKWTYVVVQYDNGVFNVYKNGVLKNDDGDFISQLSIYNGTRYIEIGEGLMNDYNGVIDDLKIYNYARTPAQVAWDYNKGKPIAHWKFDECAGSVIHDEFGNGNHGALVLGASGVTTTGTCASSSNSFWYNGRSGKRNSSGDFDGLDDYIDVGDISLNINSVSFWLKQDYMYQNIIDLDGGTHTIGIYDSKITANGFSSPTIYIDGENKETLPDTAWHHVLVTTATAIDANNLDVGRIASGYFVGQLDELKLYNYELTTTQVITDFSGGSLGFGYSGATSGSTLTFNWTCGVHTIQDIDGNTYPTVLLGTQCWMAENLMVSRNADGSAVNGTGNSNTTPPAAYGDTNGGHDGADANWEEKEGYLYNWQDAMNGSTATSAQGICPDGWHVPSNFEVVDLERYICEQEGNGSCDTTFPKDYSTNTGWIGTNEGRELKSITNVNGAAEASNGDDGYGFSLYLTGFKSGTSFLQRGTGAYIWTSNSLSPNAWVHAFWYAENRIARYLTDKGNGMSVRCVKDQ